MKNKEKKDKLSVIFFAKLAPVTSVEKPKRPQISVTCKAPKAKSSWTIKQQSDQLISQVSSLHTLLNRVTLSSSNTPREAIRP